MTKSSYIPDPADRRILAELQRHGRISNVELAEHVGLSDSPCLRRVRALEESGVIAGYRAVLDRRRLGFDVVAFVQLNLDQQSEVETSKFMEAVRREDRIVECYALSGDHDYLLKVVARTIDEFSDLTMKSILRFPGVKDLSSSFVLLDVKDSQLIPIEAS